MKRKIEKVPAEMLSLFIKSFPFVFRSHLLENTKQDANRYINFIIKNLHLSACSHIIFVLLLVYLNTNIILYLVNFMSDIS